MPHKTFTVAELKGEAALCAACSAPLVFVLNEATGKRVPVEVATMQSHFLTCSDPNRFSRPRR